MLQSYAELKLEQQLVLAVVDCVQYHQYAWKQPVSNHSGSPAVLLRQRSIGCIALQSYSELDLEQQFVLAVVDCMRYHQQTCQQFVLNQRYKYKTIFSLYCQEFI